MISGIYQIRNSVNGKLYVGSAASLRSRSSRHRHDLRKGKHHSSRLQNAWDKYGETCFVFETLLICNKENLLFYEQRAIDAINPEYNIERVAGSSLGRTHSDKTKEMLREIALSRTVQPCIGRVVSEDTKRKIGNANRGRQRSEDTLLKLRKARAGKTPSLGMRHTKEAKEAMSIARRGKTRDPDSVRRSAEGRRGQKMSDEAKAKLSEKARIRPRKPHSEETRAKMSASAKAYAAKKSLMLKPNHHGDKANA